MRRITSRFCGLLAVFTAIGLACSGEASGQPPGDPARDDLLTPLHAADVLRWRGRFEEAIERYETLLAEHPVAAAIGSARCQEAVGKRETAEAGLRRLLAEHQQSAQLHAELARLAFARGDWESADESTRAAIELDPHQPLARWIVAELARSRGKLSEAQDGYRWFARQYRPQTKMPAEDLLWFGKALAQHARFARDSGQFRRLVNELYPRLLRENDAFWPARVESAKLFLEKYNEPDATKDLNAALALNPRAAEIHALRARLALQNFDLASAARAIEQALEINPQLLQARLLEADLLMAELKPATALDKLAAARKLNPRDEETLGRLAAIYFTLDGSPDDAADSRYTRLVAEVLERNPHAGRFFQVAGASCEWMRRFPQAESFYKQALERMPELIDIRGQLGLTLMRMGDEGRAAKMLAESFAMNPFNVRVKNMLEVLDVLQGYAVLETEHFVLKFDRGLDELLALEMAEYLEREVYPDVVQRLGFAPPEKTLIEIFNRAKNTGGHGWFSARMVGLPFIGTVGACAGKMVAIVSPNSMPSGFHWARVIKHEFVHVVNLQQTDFNIPHWFTEGLAVWHEDLPRPAEWEAILARRARADRLFTLDDINLGFIRPGVSEDWTLAYCQAELYVEFMREQFGDQGPSQLLAAYAEQMDTPRAIKQAFQIAPEEFERQYREFLDRLVATLSSAPALRTARQLREAIQENATDAAALAELSQLHLLQGDAAKARTLALQAREVEPNNPLAAYVLARVYLSIGDGETALPLLEAALDKNAPDANVLALLAAMRLKENRWEAARELYQQGLDAFATDDRWAKGLARVYLETGDHERLAEVLARLAERDYDNLALRKKLAQLAADAGDHAAADRWANQVLQIDVQDAHAHALRATSLAALGDQAAAVERFQRAIRLRPDHVQWRTALAQLLIDAERTDEARSQLEHILKLRPADPRASQLREKLTP